MRRPLVCLLTFFGPMVFAQGVTSSGVGIGSSAGGIRGVQGVPFSADVTVETRRVLADGNRIHREMLGKLYRDSEGRTRTEVPKPNEETRQIVFIFDPVQQQSIHLDMEGKTANVVHLQSPSATPQVQPPETKPPMRQTIISQDERLGTRYIEGILANGAKITRTTPAGAAGNDQPLVGTSETWSSPDLKETLLSKTEDPQNGETIRKLTNIQRGEPDPSLFQVPPGFTVHENLNQ